jgi:hypothetical protein
MKAFIAIYFNYLNIQIFKTYFKQPMFNILNDIDLPMQPVQRRANPYTPAV